MSDAQRNGSVPKGLRNRLGRLRYRLPWPLAPQPLFDAAWYVAQYPDVARTRLGPSWHYRRHGWREGRDPNPYLDTDWYLWTYPDVAAAGLDPMSHYLRFGAREGRNPGPRFDAERYLRENADVAEIGHNPLLHYLRHGRREGRLAQSMTPSEGRRRESVSPPGSRPWTTAPAISPPAVGGTILAPAQMQTEDGDDARDAIDSGPLRTDVRLIAFYLPQFHPIPENDQWWGRGFTEWRNVAQARPQFTGHYQPHVPGKLGFYDLRLPETRAAQASLAGEHGIHGFCYYHYWFNGKQLLERPFAEVLESGDPDLPFCLCWANDPWSRRGNGREDDLLQAQTYSHEDDIAHIRALLPALSDHRAVRVDGKPMFLVYRARHLPSARRTTDTWRNEVARAGLPGIHLVAVETGWDLGWDATESGFDAKVVFQPQFGWLMTAAGEARRDVPGKPDLQVYDYDALRRLIERIPQVSYRRYESVFPGWDNTARVGDRAAIVRDPSPSEWEHWLHDAIERAATETGDHRMVFINAWNDWADGCHLEPDRRNGVRFLEATRRAMAVPA